MSEYLKPYGYEPIALSSESTVAADFVPAYATREEAYQSEAALERDFIEKLQRQAAVGGDYKLPPVAGLESPVFGVHQAVNCRFDVKASGENIGQRCAAARSLEFAPGVYSGVYSGDDPDHQQGARA